jgi:light-regulated signal transduction histidine kinase (bacteriophytochrome)
MNRLFRKAFPSSPRKLIAIVALAVFISESISMAAIFALGPFQSNLVETLFDASLLIILLSPILYFFVFRPMLRNINERKQAEESLKKLNEELQSTAAELALAYKDMESFSYSVSHDLRAPLRIIGALSDILLKDHHDKLDDEARRLLGAIQGHTKRMDKLVLALLDLSKAGSQEMRIDRIDMEKQALLIAADLKTTAPERKIEVTVENIPPAYGDIALIRQVLANLLSNAIKFTGARDVAVIVVGGRREDGEDVYYVKDNGTGFDMVYANKLFGVFERLHSEKEFEGIGIGLSVVERIVKRHGGRVWAEGSPDEGATFYFSLPRRSAKNSLY